MLPNAWFCVEADTCCSTARCQKAFYFDGTHISRMALAVEQNESTDPADVCVLRAIAVVFRTNPIAHYLE